MTRLKMDITKKIYDKLDDVNFNNVRFTLKSTGCTLVSSGEIEKDHHLIIEMEIAEENQMNIDNLATQTPEEKEVLDSIKPVDLLNYQRDDVYPSNRSGRPLSQAMSFTPMSKLKSNPVIQLSIDEIDKFSGEAEWNGEGLPPVGAIYTLDPYFDIKLLCKYSSKYVVIGEMLPKKTHKGMEVIIDITKQRDRIFRKPESPQQRKDRMKLEAAYDLYVTAQKAVNNVKIVTYELFTFAETINLIYWLAIVDKTNYRKESN